MLSANTPPIDWADLSDRLRISDHGAFQVVYNHLYFAVRGFIMKKVNDDALAGDLTQETFLRLWESRSNLDPQRSLQAYIYRIAENGVISHFRRKKIGLRQPLEREEPTGPSVEEQYLSQEFADQLNRSIAGLSEQTRVVFLMSRNECLSYKEIANRLNISIKTVENHIGKALKLLRLSLFEADQ